MARNGQSLLQLEKEALERRILFAESLHTVRARLTLTGLVEEVIGIADPQLSRLRPLYRSVKDHPVIAAAVLAGAAWLAAQTPNKRSGGRTAARQRVPARNQLSKEGVHP